MEYNRFTGTASVFAVAMTDLGEDRGPFLFQSGGGTFTANSQTFSPQTNLRAYFNYWGDIAGPSGSAMTGGGTTTVKASNAAGQAISLNVAYHNEGSPTEETYWTCLNTLDRVMTYNV